MRQNHGPVSTGRRVLRKRDGVEVHDVRRATAAAQLGNAFRQRATAKGQHAEWLVVQPGGCEREQPVSRRLLGPQLEVLDEPTECAQFVLTAFNSFAGQQFVAMMECQQMHVVASAYFPEQVESTLQNAAVRRIRHDLGHEEDAHELRNCTVYLQPCQVCGSVPECRRHFA